MNPWYDSPGLRPGGIRKAERAERAERALELRRSGFTFLQIADAMGVTPQTAARLFRNAIRHIAAETASEQRNLELERLDDLQRRALAIANGDHLLVSQGKAVTHPETGTPLRDPKPINDALNTLVKISERRARLQGLDMPHRTEVRHVDNIDAAIEELLGELASRGQRETPGPAESRTGSWHTKALEAGSQTQTAPTGRPGPPPP